MDGLADIEYWVISDLANEDARKAVDARISNEMEQINGGASINETHSEVFRDYDEIQRLILGGIQIAGRLTASLKGEAIDLGSGTGIAACILSNLPEVEKIYAVEFSEQFVQRMMPVVFSKFKADTRKIVRAVGDFNNLKLPSDSISMIVEIDSLHHSEDLRVTLDECCRVLKTGGFIVSIDRAWPNSHSKEQLDQLLDKEYDSEHKRLFGVDPDLPYRRRDYGEHEYRIKDWVAYYERSGFTPYVFSQVHPPFLNSLLLKVFPGFRISLNLATFLAKLGFRNLFVYGFNPTRKLIIAVKHS